MYGTDAFRLAAYHRLLSSVAAVVSLLIIAFGLWVGAWEAIATIHAQWPAIDPNEIALAEAAAGGGFVLLGLALWWTTATAIAHHVHALIVADVLAGGFETERVKSEILAVVDERLEAMHDDLDAIRDGVATDRSMRQR